MQTLFPNSRAAEKRTVTRRLCGAFILLFSALHAPLSCAVEYTGYISGEFRFFPKNAADPRQHGNTNWSVAIQPEIYHEWDDGRQSIAFVPFFRWDEHDSKRTHGDIRELLWQKAADTWELRIGIGKVFWGVAESQHLVDIINQTDLVENIDAEEKLGQPMINLALIRDWGTIDLFMLPGFRERTFPGKKGRLRSQPRVDTSQAIYDSSREKKHIDWAIRWSHFIGDWDVGISHFYGTSRDPRFRPGLDSNGEPVGIPIYDIINQTSIDVQATKGDWLWKLEALYRSGQDSSYYASIGGFEYTLVGVLDSPMDLGLIAEYSYDDRGNTSPSAFEDDLMFGMRFAFNDAQSTEILLGVVSDLDSNGRFFNLEAERRFGQNWLLSVEARAWSDIADDDPFSTISDDDYIQIDLARYF